MAAPVPPHPIAGNQTFDNFLKVIVDPKLHKERYDSLVKQAALLTERIQQTVKVKELEGARSRALKNEKDSVLILKAAEKSANDVIDEGKKYVRELRDKLEADQASLAAEQEEFRVENQEVLAEVEAESAASTVRMNAADEKMAEAKKLFESAQRIQAEYQAKAKALAALI